MDFVNGPRRALETLSKREGLPAAAREDVLQLLHASLQARELTSVPLRRFGRSPVGRLTLRRVTCVRLAHCPPRLLPQLVLDRSVRR